MYGNSMIICCYYTLFSLPCLGANCVRCPPIDLLALSLLFFFLFKYHTIPSLLPPAFFLPHAAAVARALFVCVLLDIRNLPSCVSS